MTSQLSRWPAVRVVEHLSRSGRESVPKHVVLGGAVSAGPGRHEAPQAREVQR